MTLEIRTIGSLSIVADGEEATMPTSRKTRALLAYLILSPGTHTRQSLCDLLWDTPDDPLAALRWSLSKLRPVVNQGDISRLGSDRTWVWFDPEGTESDHDRLSRAANDPDCSEAEADAAWQACKGVLLEDCEMPNQHKYAIWLESARSKLERTKVRLARRFATAPDVSAEVSDNWSRRWLDLAPYSPEAALSAFRNRHRIAGEKGAQALGKQIAERFREAGIEVPKFEIEQSGVADEPSEPLPEQEIRFLETRDGVCIAWASIGDPSNPPLVKAANWLNHLELDWGAPIWSPLFRELSRTHQVIRYDERGCGLSDWDAGEIGFDEFVEDLEQVVEASGLDRFPLLGISQGAAVSIEYAARHPERVSKLVLFGAYDCGWAHIASPDEVREREAVMVLTETGWGSDNPAYRHLFSQTFMPDALPEELDWFDEFQRQTTNSVNAVRFLKAFSKIDVRDRLAQVQCPTLVVHSRGDLRIPFATGRSIATRIPDARLAGLHSNNHLLLGREPASGHFVDLVREFLAAQE
ncbi:MAG: alpha/beta fold hydrolase [Pseudomonadota bacterium]